jgi:post-segregation antitoxin (ccd killing protein)
MRNGRSLIVACGLVLLVGALLWLYWPRRESPKIYSDQVSGSSSTPLAPTPNTGVNTVAAAATPNEAEIEKRKEQQWSAAFLTPISVYGKVVDQNGNPVSGASVEIGINNNPLPNQKGSTYVKTTDENGLFSLSSHGIAFSLRAYKEGYYSTKESTGNRNVVVPAKGDTPQPTKDHPAILVLRKQGQTEPLIARRSGQIDVPKTGQPVRIDLATGRSGDQGNLQIASWVGDYNQSRFDWRYQLSVPGGGIIERKGSFDFEAPADGYQPTAEINMPATAESWSNGGEKEYFVKLADGRYARFMIRLYPRKRNFVVIESYVNAAPGSRNLEFDPSNVVKLP